MITAWPLHTANIWKTPKWIIISFQVKASDRFTSVFIVQQVFMLNIYSCFTKPFWLQLVCRHSDLKHCFPGSTRYNRVSHEYPGLSPPVIPLCKFVWLVAMWILNEKANLRAHRNIVPAGPTALDLFWIFYANAPQLPRLFPRVSGFQQYFMMLAIFPLDQTNVFVRINVPAVSIITTFCRATDRWSRDSPCCWYCPI